MSRLEEKLKQMSENPFNQFAGVHSIQAEDDKGSLKICVNKNSINPNNKLHGGILYAFCDVCAYMALFNLLADDEEAVTHDIQVSVLRATQLNDELVFKAKVSKRGRNIAFINTEVMCGNRLIAEARVTKSILKVNN